MPEIKLPNNTPTGPTQTSIPQPTGQSRGGAGGDYGSDGICDGGAPRVAISAAPADPPDISSKAKMISKELERRLAPTHMMQEHWQAVQSLFRSIPAEMLSQIIVSQGERLFEQVQTSHDTRLGNGNIFVIKERIEAHKESLQNDAREVWDRLVEENSDQLAALKSKGFLGGAPRYTDG